MISDFGMPELLIILIGTLFTLAIGLGLPIALIVLMVRINARLKSIEEFLKRDA
jgi:hypothetical protein